VEEGSGRRVKLEIAVKLFDSGGDLGCQKTLKISQAVSQGENPKCGGNDVLGSSSQRKTKVPEKESVGPKRK